MESEISPAVTSKLLYILWLVVTPVTNLLTFLIPHLLGLRTKRKTDRKTDAEALKINAESRQIDSAIILGATERLEEQNDVILAQSRDIIHLTQENAKLSWDLRVSEMEKSRLTVDNDILNLQVQRALREGFLAREPGATANPAAGFPDPKQ